MPNKKGSEMYIHIREEALKGNYTLWPMDYQILDHLEDEGAMFGGAYPLGHTVVRIRKEVFEDKIDKGVIFPRMVSMQAQGLVVQIKGVPGTKGASIWQRTVTGKKLAEDWLRGQNNGVTNE